MLRQVKTVVFRMSPSLITRKGKDRQTHLMCCFAKFPSGNSQSASVAQPAKLQIRKHKLTSNLRRCELLEQELSVRDYQQPKRTV